MGWLLFYSGVAKLTQGFSANGYLLNLNGPFAQFFQSLAGNPLVDNLVIFGEILIGICLLLGLLVRFASFWGVVMMGLFYLTVYPPEHALIVDEHIIYILILVFFMVSNSGHFYGVDKALEKKLPKYKNLLG